MGTAVMQSARVHLRTLGRVDLLGPDGAPARAVLAQPKRLALLLYLAAAVPRGFHRKDTLLALFWPESAEKRARQSLNRSVYYLRRWLDRHVLVSRGDGEVAVGNELLWCDVAAFEGALDAGRLAEALELYHGDFAPGFFVDGLAEFERWMESERARLRDRALEAALGLAEQEEARGELVLAGHWAHRAMALAPHDERAAQRCIALRDLAGERAGALGAYEELASRLRKDLGVEPSPETRALEAAVRARQQPIAETPARIVAQALSQFNEVAAPAAVPRRTRAVRLRATWITAGALVAGAAFALAMLPERTDTIRLGRRTAVAVASEFERWPAFSPDGATIFYTLSSPPGEELFAQQVDGGSSVPLTARMPGSQRDGALSPDGTRLLFRGDEGLYVMPALGGEARRVVTALVAVDIVNVPGLLSGDWAPDGERIVYPERDTLFIQASHGQGRTALLSGRDIHSPAWSPDGRWIAFVEGNSAFHVRGNIASSVIRVVSATGGKVVSVTDGSALHTSPVWIPGRRALLFISDRDGGRDVYQLSLNHDGTPRTVPVRITTGLNPERLSISADGRRLAWSVFSETSNVWALAIPSRDSVPLSRAVPITTGNQLIEGVGNVSPDGAWLYYHSDRGGDPDLWRLPLAGGAAERLTTGPALDFAPTVSPDGREVAFHSLRTDQRDIFVMPTAGGPAVQLSTSPGDEGVPAWSPDGRAVIWLDRDTVRIARRRGDGSWDVPAVLVAGHSRGGWAQWSPDGRWVSYPVLTGLELVDPATGASRVLESAIGIGWHVWSEDARTIYGTRVTAGRRMQIVAIPVTGGRPRVLAYADHPLTQLPRYGLALHGGRLYFPLVQRNSDVWVGEVEGR